MRESRPPAIPGACPPRRPEAPGRSSLRVRPALRLALVLPALWLALLPAPARAKGPLERLTFEKPSTCNVGDEPMAPDHRWWKALFPSYDADRWHIPAPVILVDGRHGDPGETGFVYPAEFHLWDVQGVEGARAMAYYRLLEGGWDRGTTRNGVYPGVPGANGGWGVLALLAPDGKDGRIVALSAPDYDPDAVRDGHAAPVGLAGPLRFGNDVVWALGWSMWHWDDFGQWVFFYRQKGKRLAPAGRFRICGWEVAPTEGIPGVTRCSKLVPTPGGLEVRWFEGSAPVNDEGWFDPPDDWDGCPDRIEDRGVERWTWAGGRFVPADVAPPL